MKTVGIDGSRAFLKYRTGIEEYSYQVVKHLRGAIPAETQVKLYVRKKLRTRGRKLVFIYPEIDFVLPSNWQLVGIWAPRFWTQAGLSLEMLLRPVDTLFVPAHTLPLIGGRRNVVTVHGLEYEVSPESYGFWERLYMRVSIRYSCYKADTVVAVSENTKRDLMRLYGTQEEKIAVIGEGYQKDTISNFKFQISNSQPYVLFIGRIEERKNVVRIIEAFEILKERYQLPHQLVLVGKSGFGYRAINYKLEATSWKEDIIEKGYVTEEEKFELLRNADVFVFPSLYEGFGLPVLEAQAVGVPVVTSNTSSLPEVGGEGAIYADPLSSESIAKGIYTVLQMSEEEKGQLQKKGFENLERFSWEQCAQSVSRQF
jgi:glycosyltransferase involved in cell wall biosynthesis